MRNIADTLSALLLLRAPLFIAAAYRRWLDVLARATDYGTALHKATMFAEPAVVQGLIRTGGDANAPCTVRSSPPDSGSTPLHIATNSWLDNRDKVEILLTAGALPNARTFKGWTPLHEAVANPGPSVLAVIHLLISGGADVDARTEKGQTPLHLALSCSSPNARVLQALIDAGADPMALDKNDRTPLHEAAGSTYVNASEVLTVLIDAGGDVRP